MSSLSAISAVSATSPIIPGSKNGPTEMRQAFQDAVGGLFYGQMIKALRSGVGKPAYIYGGQAEEMFQAQMDQKVTESLARSHGGPFIEDLYQRFLVDHPEGKPVQSDPLSTLMQSVKSAPTLESAQDASWARPATSVSRITTDTGVIPALNRK